MLAALLIFLSLMADSVGIVEHVVRDLRGEFLVFDGNQLAPASGNYSGEDVVHFRLTLTNAPDETLVIRSSEPVTVFLNGKLSYGGEQELRIPLAELRKKAAAEKVLIGVYQKNLDIGSLNVVLVKKEVARDLSEAVPDRSFRDFVILSGLFIIIVFLVLLRTNPKLSADYFSLPRVVALREVDDTQTHSRFMLSSNAGFYLLASLIVSYVLTIIFYAGKNEVQPLIQVDEGFVSFLFNWLGLSLLILCVFLLKLILIFALSWLFGMRNLAGAHFFNWARLILIMTSVLSIIIFLLFINRSFEEYFDSFLVAMVVLMAAWIVIAFLRFSSRSQHSMFHLFSYICATEVIPLLITVKILFE